MQLLNFNQWFNNILFVAIIVIIAFGIIILFKKAKHWYWFRGLIIGFIIAFLCDLFLLAAILPQLRNINISPIVNIIFFLDFTLNLTCIAGLCTGYGYYVVFHFVTIYFSYAIIGAIIGLVYEKIKNIIKNKKIK